MTDIGHEEIQDHVRTTEPLKQSAEAAVRIQSGKAALRSFICGYVDAYSLLTFGVYASFMTGNTTSGGVHTGQWNTAAAGHSLLPIPFFMLGIFTGTLTVDLNRPRSLSRLSIVVAILLFLDIFCTFARWPGWSSIMMLSFAMGLTNTSVTSVGAQAVSLGFMTGDLNNLAKQIVEAVRRKPVVGAQGPWDTQLHRIRLLAGLWVAFFMGAICGAVVSPHLGARMLLFPALTLLVLGFIERTCAVPC